MKVIRLILLSLLIPIIGFGQSTNGLKLTELNSVTTISTNEITMVVSNVTGVPTNYSVKLYDIMRVLINTPLFTNQVQSLASGNFYAGTNAGGGGGQIYGGMDGTNLIFNTITIGPGVAMSFGGNLITLSVDPIFVTNAVVEASKVRQYGTTILTNISGISSTNQFVFVNHPGLSGSGSSGGLLTNVIASNTVATIVPLKAISTAGTLTNLIEAVSPSGTIMFSVGVDGTVSFGGAGGSSNMFYDATGTSYVLVVTSPTGTNRTIEWPRASGTLLLSNANLSEWSTIGTNGTVRSTDAPSNGDVITWHTGGGITWDAPSASAGGSNYSVLYVTNTYRLGETNITVSSTNAVVLDLASWNIFKLLLMTNTHIVFSNQYAGLVNGLVYFKQDSTGNRTIESYRANGGLVLTNASMVLSTDASALDLLEVKSDFWSTNLLAYWPKDFQPRVVATNSWPSVGSLSISNETYAVGEGDGSITITVIRYGGSDDAASCNIWTSNGTAVAGSDYTTNNQTLNWSGGESGAKTFVVSILNDVYDEVPETFSVCISAITGAATGTNTITEITITDNDAAPEPGQIASIEIQTNGWQAAVTMYQMPTNGNYDYGFAGSTNNNYTTTNFLLTVSSPGFDDNGVSNRQTRYVMGTKTLRYPYPDEANTNRITTNADYVTAAIALSDFIGWDDTITAVVATNWYKGASYGNRAANGLSVANNSVCGYGSVIAQWSLPPYRRITNDTYDLNMVAFHRSARDGRPVRCVKFWGTTPTATNAPVIVTTLDTNGFNEPTFVMEYRGTLYSTNLPVKTVVTNHFAAYPWIGTANEVYDTSTKGYPADHAYAGPYKLFNDRDNTWGNVVAIVDPVNGVVNGVVSSNMTEALATPPTPFISIAAAFNAIATAQDTWYGHQDLAGATVWLTNGSHAMFTNGPGTGGHTVRSNPVTWVHLTRHPNANSNDVIITTNSTSLAQDYNLKLKVSEVTIVNPTNTGSAWTFVYGFNWLDLVHITTNSADMGHVFYSTTNDWVTRSLVSGRVADWHTLSASSRQDTHFFRGNHFYGGRVVIACPGLFMGNYVDGITNGLFGVTAGAGSNNVANDYFIVAYNKMLKISSQGGGIKIGWETNMENGAAIIQNMTENCSSGNVRIGYAGQSGSDTINRTRNIMQWHNTYVGESFIDRYHSIASTNNWYDCTDSLCKYVGNFFGEYATKQDVFGDPGENGWRTNRWTALFSVGSIGNACGGLTSGGSFNPEYGIQGGFSGLSHRMTGITNQNNAAAIAFDFVSDLSFRYPAAGGTNSVGGGDYHMGANSIASGIVPVLVIPYDLEGQPRTTNSNPGAYVQAP